MNIKQKKKDIAYKIVDFWHIVEFMSQESFPQNTRENAKKVEFVRKEQQGKIKKDKERDERRINKFTLFYNLPMEFEIPELLRKDNEFYRKYPFCSSAMHLCIGKVKREVLIKALYKYLNLTDDRPEEDLSSVCLIGIKVDKDGVYVENSLRISPLVWGIYKCYKANGKVDGIITSNNYHDDIKAFEGEISKIEPLGKADIQELYSSVFDKYISPICENNIESKLDSSFIYSRYDSEKTFNREDEKAEDISELVKGFYTDDLEMIKEYLKHINDDTNKSSSIIDYIIGAYYEYYGEGKIIDDAKRINIRDDKTYMEKWLHADKAPYGKWPSRFSPALMQQIAINIGISETDEIGKIFSVNGPPGTGKTTLLKEIIVSNIVNRAKYLCKYNRADEAFEARFFEHGNFANKGYDKYCNKYYAFKDKELSDFSMMVASCNNAAVENITKELPDGKALLTSLDVDKQDSEEISKGLLEVADLFDIAKNNNTESYKIFIENNGKRRAIFIEKSDIYFSWLAHKLMSKSDEYNENLRINAWGLISAPMGKTSNIGKYCYNVLNEVIESFYASNNMIEQRNSGFQSIKEEFSNQFLKVEEMKKELSKVSHLSEAYKAREVFNRKLIFKHQDEISKLNKDIRRHIEDVQKYESEKTNIINYIAIVQSREDKFAEALKNNELDFEELKIRIETIKENIICKEDSRKWYEILFGKWMKTERLRQIVELKEELKETDKAIETAKSEVEASRSRFIEATQEKDKYENQLSKIIQRIEKERSSIRASKNKIEQENKVIEKITENIFNDRKELQDILSAHNKRMVIINEKFWTDFGSDNEEISTSIQTANPWLTEEYNREREKLFYLALQLHKEFILSSTACRDNFKNLAMMWRYRENSERELCFYSQEDKNKSYKHLLDTLFLLTPVMSSTFASVGRFLGNIKEQGSLGLLIIDEAGQAAPHVALGALWRCKKAIVVGDPKQVEPVVTDDADAIKKAFSDKVIIPYMNKTISVQEFADRLNRFGSYIKDTINSDTPPTWVGCPLVVHRRCINPMFDISNELSYGRTMKICTLEAKERDKDKFAKEESCWINVSGKENGNKNHFIHEQGKVALEIIIKSFKKYDKLPDLYVISPFITVINGIKDMVNQSDELKVYKEDVETWTDNYCGTVHKFQGKEAKEVIFLLGCDEKANGAVRWVKPNIVNVAATRAKYRLYVIGDYKVWSKSKIFEITKRILDNSLSK